MKNVHLLQIVTDTRAIIVAKPSAAGGSYWVRHFGHAAIIDGDELVREAGLWPEEDNWWHAPNAGEVAARCDAFILEEAKKMPGCMILYNMATLANADYLYLPDWTKYRQNATKRARDPKGQAYLPSDLIADYTRYAKSEHRSKINTDGLMILADEVAIHYHRMMFYAENAMPSPSSLSRLMEIMVEHGYSKSRVLIDVNKLSRMSAIDLLCLPWKNPYSFLIDRWMKYADRVTSPPPTDVSP